jgi:hypothetical protein
MATISTQVSLVFVRDFSEREAQEARDRGCLSHVLVEVDGQRLYPVFFYDPVRLAQDLTTSAEHGQSFIAETGMIVLPEVTIENMRDAVNALYKEGFFDHLIPVDRDRLAKADPYAWPP